MKMVVQICPVGAGDKQNAVLDQLAAAAQRLGHCVDRWNVKDLPHKIPVADVVVFWNGMYNWASKIRKENEGQRFLFAELGWLPQEPCWQLDHAGPNAMSSWARDFLAVGADVPAPQPKGDFLVVLQDDADTQIYSSYLSPMFRRMVEFLAFLGNRIDVSLRVRDHPAHPCSLEARAMVESCGVMRWDESSSLVAALGDAAALLTINSSCGVKALEMGIPLLSFGRSVWTSVAGASYCIFGEADPEMALKKAVEEIMRGRNSLNKVAQQAALGRIMSKQWWPEQLPERLAWALR